MEKLTVDKTEINLEEMWDYFSMSNYDIVTEVINLDLMMHCMKVVDWMCMIVGISIMVIKMINKRLIIITQIFYVYGSKSVKFMLKVLLTRGKFHRAA